ncbi:MAG: hypothetical protein IJ694_09435 [Acidaminococcaceae bacterium]|nr:hypothetical protein [Acidaminococcaceae bacterium]
MKKIIVFLLCLTTALLSGCGDKFAKEKEAIAKTEKAVLSTQVPILIRPDPAKQPPPTKQEYAQYQAGLSQLVETEKKMLAQMRKSDAQIAAMLGKADSESEKKDLLAFRDKVRKDRIQFVKKISRGRLCGDTFTVGIGNTWQEIEMVYGKPLTTGNNVPGIKTYGYQGVKFEDMIGGGVPSPERAKKWVSRIVQCIEVTGRNVTSDAGVRIGMTRDEVRAVLQSKYVSKNPRLKSGEMKMESDGNPDGYDALFHFAMQDTEPYNLFFQFKKGKLIRYSVAPN